MTSAAGLTDCWNLALLMGTSLSPVKVIWWLPRLLASDAFAGLGISVVCCHSFLGGVIGEATQCEDLIQLKVNGWVHSINALAKAAKKSP